jgi:hypothetical protein
VTGYDRPPSANSQCGRILKLLTDAKGAWVPMPELMKLAAQYSARVKELRDAGFAIENRTETVDGVRHGWFRLPVAPPKPIAPVSIGAGPETMPLFGKDVR